MKTIKFIDLFSGIGAFHISIKDLFKDSQCVAAFEQILIIDVKNKHMKN
ncbi:hypothetical protein [Spiroplasma endosymbiont of Thecophora atra]